jgi:2'-5' RNA ligase
MVAKMTESTRAAGLMPRESGIILPIPEAEAAVGHLRRLHDPQASYGVPAHITLLYPFAHPSRVDEAAGALQKLFRLVPAFEFSLVEVRRFPATAYLHPEPSAPFVQLTEKLVHRWPEFPPYGGAFSLVIPHLTVADRVAADVLNAIDRDVSNHLPIRCRATEAWLMCSDEHGFWSRHDVFPFSQS